MVREGLCEKVTFKLRMRDEEELSRGRVERKVFHPGRGSSKSQEQKRN